MATEGIPPPPDEELAKIRDVVGRAKRGDATTLPVLREMLDRYPAIWQRYGDLASHVELSWVTLAAGDDLHLRESLVRFAAQQRAELTRTNAGAIERLLVERAIACWLQLHFFSGIEANAVVNDASPKVQQYRARRHGQAQRMYERALAALLTVQRLIPVDRVHPATAIEKQSDSTSETPSATNARCEPSAIHQVGGTENEESGDRFESIPQYRGVEPLQTIL